MILDFFKTAANLKKIHRQGWIEKLSLDSPESVADHSYSMAIIGMVISDLQNYDSEKIIKMILLHDLAESKIVHQIDKLEMVLQAKIYEKDGHSQEKLESFFESARIDITDPKLKELFTKIIKDM
jgi:putative hydrolase of HD superfamily